MAQGLCPPFDLEAYREGHLTPVYLRQRAQQFRGARIAARGRRTGAAAAPAAGTAPTGRGPISPTRSAVAGFVFKVQANIDPQHRDRIAFVRIVLGPLPARHEAEELRTGRLMSVQNPVFFLARERNLAEEAWPGDIIGIPNHGSLRIGDTLTEGEEIRVTGLPSFAPEILRRVRVEDPMKSEASAPRADATGRRGRDPRVQAGQRQRLDHRRRRRACSSMC